MTSGPTPRPGNSALLGQPGLSLLDMAGPAHDNKITGPGNHLVPGGIKLNLPIPGLKAQQHEAEPLPHCREARKFT